MSEHKADQKLDKLIAEKVMGGVDLQSFVCPKCESIYFGSHQDEQGQWIRRCHNPFGCGWSGKPEEALPQFSQELTAAWDVLEKVLENEYTRVKIYTDESVWVCKFKNGPWHISGIGIESTISLAICIAALQTVEN